MTFTELLEPSVQLLAERLLAASSESEVGLWWVIADIEELLGITDPERVHRIAMSIYRALIQRCLVELFNYNPDGTWTTWRGSPDELLARIEQEWSRHGERARKAEIVRFMATNAGLKVISDEGLNTKFRDE